MRLRSIREFDRLLSVFLPGCPFLSVCVSELFNCLSIECYADVLCALTGATQ